MKKIIGTLLSLYLVIGIVCASVVATVFAPRALRSATQVPLYAADGISPQSGVIQRYDYEKVYYDHSNSTAYYNPYRVPPYYASGLSNACAITAGGAVIGYYDRLYEELIPNHTGITFMGKFAYGNQDDAVDAMHQELYTRMGTTDGGTTIPGFVDGLGSYVQSKGRNATITKAFESSLDLAACMTAVDEGKLVTVFVDGFSLLGMGGPTARDGYDEINSTIVVGRHTVTVFGYMLLEYYDAAGSLLQEDQYLYCHSGFASAGLGMIRLSKYTVVEDAYIIDIT